MTYGIGIEPMMKHYTRILAFLMTLSTQASADEINVGDVFYCEVEAGAGVLSLTNWEIKEMPLLKFKVQITNENNISFLPHLGGQTHAERTAIGLTPLAYRHNMIARFNDGAFYLNNVGRFTFTSIIFGGASMATGTCDKF